MIYTFDVSWQVTNGGKVIGGDRLDRLSFIDPPGLTGAGIEFRIRAQLNRGLKPNHFARILSRNKIGEEE